MIQNTKFVKNFVIELKNANSNGRNIVLRNKQSSFYDFVFFSKNIENWVK